VTIDLCRLSDIELETAYLDELRKLGITSEAQAVVELDQVAAHDLEVWSRVAYEYPLADAILWEKEDAPWDQRRLVASLTGHLSLVLGGNRSGKTYAILERTVAEALGGDHPAVIAWLEANDLPRDLIKPGPARVWLVAQTAGTSIEFHRLTIEKLLPAFGKHWRSQSNAEEASVEIDVPGYDEKAVIVFKSVDQEQRSFKGSNVRWVAISEEPEGDKGRLVLEECLRGTAACGGRVVIECTPQHGFTWVWDDLYEKRLYNCKVIELDSEHNVLVEDHAALMSWLESLPPEQRAMRQKGKFTDLKGLIYPSWARGDGSRSGMGHLCKPFDIPKDRPRFRGGDWGLVLPTVVLWGFLDDDDTLYLYRCYYLANGGSYDHHARNAAALEVVDEVLEDGRTVQRREPIEMGWGDPSEPKAFEAMASLELYFALADNDVQGGFSAVHERLRIRPDGRPRLKVFDTEEMRPLIKEIEGYRRDPKRNDGAPIKKNDHAMDALRYLCMGIKVWHGMGL
jgi:hypothetical protein